MEDGSGWVRSALLNAAVGHNTHAHMVQAVSDLSGDEVGAKMGDGTHTIWENLWHTTFCQRLLLDGIQGHPIPFESTIGKDWPASNSPGSPQEWEKLVTEFAEGTESIRHLTADADLAPEIPGWGGMTVGAVLMMYCSHTSYHIGQIVQTRIALGLWPPKE